MSTEGFIARPGGHRIHFERTGTPDGTPLLVMHGGPGSGLSHSTAARFDPACWSVISFDQRGCGQSTPSAAGHDNDLADNTTAHLIGDIEALRQELDIERFVLFGSSWGSTLALAYVQLHPEHVLGLILAGVTTTRWSEIDWLYNGLRLFLPEAWETFTASVPPTLRTLHPVAAYHALLNDDDPAVRQAAADAWHTWETGSISPKPQEGWPQRWQDPQYRLARARLCAHYFHHRAWLTEEQLLRNADRLKGIPGLLIQGRLDLQGPPLTAHALAKAWPGCELIMVEGAGHSTGDSGIADAITSAADRMLHRLAE